MWGLQPSIPERRGIGVRDDGQAAAVESSDSFRAAAAQSAGAFPARDRFREGSTPGVAFGSRGGRGAPETTRTAARLCVHPGANTRG